MKGLIRLLYPTEVIDVATGEIGSSLSIAVLLVTIYGPAIVLEVGPTVAPAATYIVGVTFGWIGLNVIRLVENRINECPLCGEVRCDCTPPGALQTGVKR